MQIPVDEIIEATELKNNAITRTFVKTLYVAAYVPSKIIVKRRFRRALKDL